MKRKLDTLSDQQVVHAMKEDVETLEEAMHRVFGHLKDGEEADPVELAKLTALFDESDALLREGKLRAGTLPS